jgi:membrane fusion protein, multidrug efflux system
MTAGFERMHRAARRAVVLSAMVAVASACQQDGRAAEADSGTAEPMQVGVENIAVAEQRELQSGPAISGSLEPHWSATVRAEVPGAVIRTYAERGERVRSGALLARLDDRAIRDTYLSARAGERTAESAAAQSRRDLERTESLVRAGAVAEQALEQQRVALQNAEAALADARARLANAEKQLRATEVRAPDAGIVSERSVQAGDVVQPGSALFTVVDPSRMKLEAAVPASQLSEIRVGAPVEFTVTGYPDRAFTGRVDRVSPIADPATGQVRITVALPNTAGELVGGLFAEGRVASRSRTGIVVPESAVDLRGLRPLVRVLRQGTVARVEVELGLRDEANDRVEVTSGLAAGDTLLLGAAQGIAPGTPVRVRPVADAPRTTSRR